MTHTGAAKYSLADNVLQQITARLAEAYHPECIYLFGSVARGEGGPDSDYDLMLVMPDDARLELLNAQLAYQVLWGIKASADVHIMPRKLFDSRLHLKASLQATILEEGKLLYVA